MELRRAPWLPLVVVGGMISMVVGTAAIACYTWREFAEGDYTGAFLGWLGILWFIWAIWIWGSAARIWLQRATDQEDK